MELNDKMSSTLSSIVKVMHSTLSSMQSVNKENDSLGNVFKKAQQNIIEAEKELKNFDNQINKTNSTMTAGTSIASSFFGGMLPENLESSAIRKFASIINNQLGDTVKVF